MSSEHSMKRRAIYTGLWPYMDANSLIDALHHWESHYRNKPRFSLQYFVRDLCEQNRELRPRRSDILLNLVQTMNMPERNLLADPLAEQDRKNRHAPSPGATRAFVLLTGTLFAALPEHTRASARRDLLESVRRASLPESVWEGLHQWLADHHELSLPDVRVEILQALTSRLYVVLCERMGPVEADRLLARTMHWCQQDHPELATNLAELL